MVGYAALQREAQKLLENEAASNTEEGGVSVEDLSVDKSKGDFSSSSIKSTIKYRFKNAKLNAIIEIPQLKFKQYLEDGNNLPDFIESYREESVTIRKSF